MTYFSAETVVVFGFHKKKNNFNQEGHVLYRYDNHGKTAYFSMYCNDVYLTLSSKSDRKGCIWKLVSAHDLQHAQPVLVTGSGRRRQVTETNKTLTTDVPGTT